MSSQSSHGGGAGPRRRAAAIAALAVVIVLAVAAVALVLAGEGDDEGSPLPATTIPPADGPPPLVLAGAGGVTVVAGTQTVRVSDRAAASAYAVGRDLVAYQEAEPAVGRVRPYPPVPTGPVRLWEAGAARSLAPAAGSVRTTLLDLRMLGSAPAALVAERFGGTSPTDTFEELVRVNLRDGTRVTLVRRPAWESAHLSARLLPDGGAVGLYGVEVELFLARWSQVAAAPLWEVPVGADTRLDVSLRNGAVTVLGVGPGPGGRHGLVATAYDLATGRPGASEAVAVEGTAAGLVCPDWLTPSELLCGRAGEAPVAFTVGGGRRSLPGELGDLPTTARPA